MVQGGNLDVPAVARQQLKLFLRLAEMAGLDAERQRNAFRLSQEDWRNWLDFLHDAPLPARPAVPLMLRHLGHISSRLERSIRAERAYA